MGTIAAVFGLVVLGAAGRLLRDRCVAKRLARPDPMSAPHGDASYLHRLENFR